MTEPSFRPHPLLSTAPARWLQSARVAWAILALVTVGLYTNGLLHSLRQPLSLCLQFSQVPCSEAQVAAALSRLGLSPTSFQGYQTALIDVLVPFGCVALGLLVFWRLPNNWLGLAASALLICYALAVNTAIMAVGLVGTPWAAAYSVFNFGLFAVFVVALVYLLYTFPDGRWVAGWARWPAALTLVAGILANVTALPSALTAPPLLLLLGLALGLQVYRFRSISTPTERQQTKWVLVGLAGFTANAGLWLLVVLPALKQGAAGFPLQAVFLPVNAVLVLALPITLAFSILRYRLWDIDLIIRRTLVYSVLSVLLALAYLGSIVVLQELVRGLTGQQSSVTVVASTLIIAALFSPLRRRVQDFIDRRFYRHRYDAAQTLAQFGASLRDHVELDQLTGQLLAVVDKSIQPTHLSLWLSDLGAPPAQAPDAGAAPARSAPDTPAGSPP